jgi:Zn-dependent protease with chaperone function
MNSLRTKGFGLGLLALAATAGVRPAHAITDQEEIEAGRQVAQQSIKEYGRPLPPSDPRQQRVSRIGAMFVRQGQRRNIPYSFTVLQNDKVLNAFAAPGGPVFVTTKLIATTQNDAELAYVLGHEFGHIELRHVVKGAQRSQTTGIFAGIGGAVLGQVLGGGRNADVIGSIAGVGAQLYQKGFSRSQESQADDYGTRAMARLGFDPRAAVSMLGRLGDSSGGFAKYLSDHPDSRKRQQLVQKEINNENLVAVANNNGGPFLSLTGSSAGYAPSYGSSNDGEPFDGAVYASGQVAPFRARSVNGVVMAPIVEMARLAGGEARGNSTTMTISAGNASGTFRLGSDQAQLGGRTATLTAPVQRIGGQLYAPIGAISYALGGRATLNPNSNTASVSWSDGRANVVRY